MHPSLKSRYDKTNCLRANRKAIVGKVVRKARMILDIPRHHLLVTFKKGRVVLRVTNKQLLEHPEQPLWPLSLAIKWKLTSPR